MKQVFIFLLLFISFQSFSQNAIILTERSGFTNNEWEIQTKDLGKMTYENAKKACSELGKGWGLPTEFNVTFLYDNQKICGFVEDFYWLDSERNSFGMLMTFDFYDGSRDMLDKNSSEVHYVRAIRKVVKK